MSIIINIDKAKVIWRDKWRGVRQPLLSSLDVQFMRAVETGDMAKQAEIAAKKQALRDVTLTEINASTPEEIKAIWPSVLGEQEKVPVVQIAPEAPAPAPAQELMPEPESDLKIEPALTPEETNPQPTNTQGEQI